MISLAVILLGKIEHERETWSKRWFEILRAHNLTRLVHHTVLFYAIIKYKNKMLERNIEHK